jgi:hypothetical protein
VKYFRADVSGWQTASTKTTPTQRPAVPRAEHQSCLKSRQGVYEARGIGSAGLKGYLRNASKKKISPRGEKRKNFT